MSEAKPQPKPKPGKHHILKTWPVFFNAIGSGQKNFEVRFNDRGYQVGDSLELREYDPIKKEYTSRWIWCRVGYVLTNFEGIKDGWCVLGLLLPSNHMWPIYKF